MEIKHVLWKQYVAQSRLEHDLTHLQIKIHLEKAWIKIEMKKTFLSTSD